MPRPSSGTIGVCVTTLLALACDRNASKSRAAGTGASLAPSVSAATPHVERKDAASMVLRGDTFDLVISRGAEQQSLARGQFACNSAAARYSEERLVFSTDSTYESFAVLRHECWDKHDSSSDTLQTGSMYRLRGDTVKLYTGDGDEIFDSGSLLIVGDSLVPFAVSPDSSRFARRRHPRN